MNKKFLIIAGPCVLEDFETAFYIAKFLKDLVSKFDFPVDPGFFINWDLGMVGNILSRFKWEYFLFGFGILALSEVFKKGLEYQEDSSSIL